MNFIITELPSFNIAGVSIRTANTDGRARKEIGALWQQFMDDQLLQNIPNRFCDDIYCMYTEYESDANAPYTVILGCRVNLMEEFAQDILGKTVPSAVYRVYTSAGVDGVVETWMHIWQSDIDRAYAADFDVYKQDGTVETYLSVKQ